MIAIEPQPIAGAGEALSQTDEPATFTEVIRRFKVSREGNLEPQQSLPPRDDDKPVIFSPPGNEALPSWPQGRSAPPLDGDDADLLMAFLEGAGVDRRMVRTADARAFLRDAGHVFSRMAGGLRDLLAVRALIKVHARLQRTEIGAHQNNPLKFSTDATEATLALLEARGEGYLRPLEAVDAALRDLKAHELALLDGLQSALDGLLRSFDPASLESRLPEGGIFTLLLYGGRQARLWQLYGERYAEIAKSAGTHFMGDFDEAFRAAYERKIVELAARAAANPERSGA
jgi:type VI secretion system FHA domain protein